MQLLRATRLRPTAVFGGQFSTLSVQAGAAGTYPYSATVFPLIGAVPAGTFVSSFDDPAMRSSVLSTHSDGSASVVVVSGQVTVTLNQASTLRLSTSTGSGGGALTTAAISDMVTNVSVAFGSPYGTASISSFGSPERIWWANGQVICARYRVAAPTPGSTSLEAVIDIHAYAGRALVEVVVENCRFTASSATTASKPAAANYTAAVVSVNGSTVTTVNGNGAPEGNHAAFRSWYASTWVGGDPGLRVTQAVADLQQHPLLFKMARASTFDMTTYASDAYTPWSTGRQRATDMGGTGDHDSIGTLPKWEAHFLQSGDYRAAKAVEASALALLGYNINYRDTSGVVPDATLVAGKTQSGSSQNWPREQPGGGTGAMEWDAPHQPAAGLMAFACRPSPVYIELAQKVSVWNATWSAESSNLGGYTATWPDADYTGIFGNAYTLRGRAWSLRNLGYATFLSPDGSAWKTGGRFWLNRNRIYLENWTTDSKALLNCMWDSAPNDLTDHDPGTVGLQQPLWMYHWLITELHKIASTGILSGSQQTSLNALADWCAQQPVRWVNEQANGGWRYVTYDTSMGRSGTTVDSLPDWGSQRAWQKLDSPPTVAGTFFTSISTEPNTYAAHTVDTHGLNYVESYWQAFCVAMERQVSGYQAAWNTVQANVTNLSTWLDGFATDPRQGNYPKVVPSVWGAGATPGTAPTLANGYVWTPGVDSSGLVNQVSWNLVPPGQWTKVASSSILNLDTRVKNTNPAWRGYGSNDTDWSGVVSPWTGVAKDPLGGRMWLFGGGHNDSSNNGLYRFDAFKMAWAVEKQPSDPTPWTPSYKAGGPAATFTIDATSGVNAKTAYDAGHLSATNDLGYEELVSDHQPTARHTYNGLVYMAGRNQIAMAGRRLWIFDLATNSWNYKRAWNDELTSLLDSSVWTSLATNRWGENMFGMYDEATSELLVSSRGSSGSFDNIKFNASAQTWGSWTWTASSWNLGGMVRNGRNVTIVRPPGYSIADGGNPEYAVYNLDSRTTTVSGVLSCGSGVNTRQDLNSTVQTMQSLIYVPSINRYWYLAWDNTPADTNMTWHEIDPTVSPWTIKLKTDFTGAVPVIAAAGPTEPGGKHMYIPSIDSILFFYRGGSSGEMFIYRLS
jgi:hypothetical protein